MHDLIPACCSSFLQLAASAHLRGPVKNGPGDACTYTCVMGWELGLRDARATLREHRVTSNPTPTKWLPKPDAWRITTYQNQQFPM